MEIEIFTESWREALNISIPKTINDHFDPLRYRPITLTSCICKIVERMVNERHVWFSEKNYLLAKQQCGYRANRSFNVPWNIYSWCFYSKPKS